MSIGMNDEMEDTASTLWATRLVRLYPSAWRDRYGDEFVALLVVQLATGPRSPRIVFDVVRGAFDAHLHGDAVLGRVRPMVNRLRASEIVIFCAFIAFVVAGIGYQKMTEYDDFMSLAHAHPEVGIPFYSIVVGSGVALLAILAGGVPIAFVALRRALAARRWDIIALFGVPVVSFLALVGSGLVIFRLSDKQIVQMTPAEITVAQSATAGPTPRDSALFLVLVGIFVLAAVASAWAVSAAIARSELPARLIRFAFAPALVAAAMMLVMLAAMVVWGFAVSADAPALFNGNDGLVASNTTASYLVIVVVMGIATVAALIAGIRGARARSAAGVLASA